MRCGQFFTAASPATAIAWFRYNYVRMFQRIAVLTVVLHLWPNIASAQHVSVGAKAGAPLTQAFQNDAFIPRFVYRFNTKRYTIGPTAEVSFPLGLRFEADVLYTRLDYDSTVMGVDTFTRSATKANSWQVPLLLKKDFSAARLSPYGDIGFALRHVGGTSHIVNTVFPSRVFDLTTNPLELVRDWTNGFVIGGGIEFRAGPLRLSPELRYTRWFRENFRAPSGIFQSNLNEADVLLGLRWREF
jgi:opacity protein-like surface antigen